jgi:hypothetical protein
VDSKISVSAAHNVAERTRVAILLALPTVSEVLVHVDAEHDHPDPASFLTPANRQKLKIHSTPSPSPPSSSTTEHAQEHPQEHEQVHEHPSSETEGLILPGRLMLSQRQVEKEVRSTLERLNGELIESGSSKVCGSLILLSLLSQKLMHFLSPSQDNERSLRDHLSLFGPTTQRRTLCGGGTGTKSEGRPAPCSFGQVRTRSAAFS